MLASFIALVVIALILSCLICLYPCFLGKDSSNSSRALATALSLGIVVVTCSLYLLLGQPQTIIQPWLAEYVDQKKLKKLVDQARIKLQTSDQENIDTWLIVARGQIMLGEFSAARDTLEQAMIIDENNVEVLSSLAEVSALINDDRYDYDEIALLDQAYSLNPNHQKTLWLLAIAFGQKNNIKKTLEYLRKLEPLLDSYPDWQNEVQGQISLLSSKANTIITAENNIEYSIDISLGPTLDFSAKPNAVVFVFASQLNGLPMPVAAVRLELTDLPTTIVLDDTDSLSSDLLLSSLEAFTLTARISLSATPKAQAGDAFGTIRIDQTQARQTQQLVIDQIVEP